MNTETRDAAAKAMQDVIKERTCIGIGIGVIREALDTAFPITVTPTNPTPVIETANGAVDIEPNPTPGPHHTTRRNMEPLWEEIEVLKLSVESMHERIEGGFGTHWSAIKGFIKFQGKMKRRLAELNEVVSALAESNNNLVDNQQIHEAAIVELEKSLNQTKRRVADMDRDLMPLVGKVAELQRRVESLEKGADALNDRLIAYEMGISHDDDYEEGEPGWDDVERGKSLTSARLNGATTPEENVYTPPQPTPPAALDEDALWQEVFRKAWKSLPIMYANNKDETYEWFGHISVLNQSILGTDYEPMDWDVLTVDERESLAEFAKIIARRAANLGLVPTPRIEVTQDDVVAVAQTYIKSTTQITHHGIRTILQDFASRKNGGA